MISFVLLLLLLAPGLAFCGFSCVLVRGLLVIGDLLLVEVGMRYHFCTNFLFFILDRVSSI